MGDPPAVTQLSTLRGTETPALAKLSGFTQISWEGFSSFNSLICRECTKVFRCLQNQKSSGLKSRDRADQFTGPPRSTLSTEGLFLGLTDNAKKSKVFGLFIQDKLLRGVTATSTESLSGDSIFESVRISYGKKIWSCVDMHGNHARASAFGTKWTSLTSQQALFFLDICYVGLPLPVQHWKTG